MIKDNNDGTFSIVAPCSFDNPKPVAWMYEVNDTFILFSANKPPEDAYDEGSLVPLYTAPRELSDEEIINLAFAMGFLTKENLINEWSGYTQEFIAVIKAILKKASEK